MSENSLRLAASCYLDVLSPEDGGRCILRDTRTVAARISKMSLLSLHLDYCRSLGGSSDTQYVLNCKSRRSRSAVGIPPEHINAVIEKISARCR